MLKSIKKSFKYFIIATGIILAIPVFLYSIIRIPEVQTFIVKRITSHLSNEIQTTVSVGKIKYSFFNVLNINDLIIKDQNNDTLVYSAHLTTGIRKLDFRNKIIRLGKVELTEPYIALITDSAGSMNLKWYLDLIRKSPPEKKGKKKSQFHVNSIFLKDARFVLRNMLKDQVREVINFNNLQLSQINGYVNDLNIESDSVDFTINELEFKEIKGFSVMEMDSRVAISGNRLVLSDVSIKTGKSIINADLVSIKPDSADSFNRFAEEVKLNIILKRSLLTNYDLSYFLPVPEGINESVWIRGKVTGTVSELKGRNIELEYRENSRLDCDFDLSGLPRIEDTFIFIGVNNLETNAKDLEKIQFSAKGDIALPEMLYKLDNISFNGNFTGFTTDFVAYGKLNTGKGNMSTDISLRPEGKNAFRINGLVTGRNIDLGELTGNNEMFGRISMKADVNIDAVSLQKFSGSLNGRVDSAELNNYKYRNIEMNGSFSEKTWDGSIRVVDQNVKADILGLFNFKDSLPEFNFTLNLNNANLHLLNFDKADSSSRLSLLMTANFKGNNIDNLFGEIKLLNSTLRKYNNTLDLYDFSLKAFTQNYKPAISIRTDFVDADLHGYYSFNEIKNLVRGTLASLMPSEFKMDDAETDKTGNRFSFSINFKNTDRINEFFKTGLLLADKSYISGMVYPDSLISVYGRSEKLSYKKSTFNKLSVEATIKDQKLNSTIKSTALLLPGNSELRDFKSEFNTWPDNFIFSLNWDNKDKILNKGVVVARGSLIPGNADTARPVLKVIIDPSEIYTGNNLWKISRSEITVDSTMVSVNRLFINSGENYYLVDGTISENPQDMLYLGFKGINLNPLNYMGENNNRTKVSLDLGGVLNGNIKLTDIYKDPMVESSLVVNDFSILGAKYGDLKAESVWNAAVKVADIKADAVLEGKTLTGVSGFYDPALKKLNLNINTDNLPLDALNPLLKFFASDIHGTASGRINLSGELNRLVLKGALYAENSSMKIDYLKTKYSFTDSVYFNRDGISMKNIRLTDEKGNYATISGTIFHNYFKNYAADLTINMYDCLVLNTQPKDNDLFYGTVFASGVTTIRSGQGSLSFDISARTMKNTKFFIPLNSGMSVSEYSFVSFISPDSSSTGSDERQVEISQNASGSSALDLNLDLNITPDAEVQLLIDPKAGDVISGRGAGNLNINLSKKGEFKISGDYIIEDGNYLFTLGNILNKSFTVENGGKITFPGDIENADIDLKAIYKLRTSLYEILQDERFNERIPVECQLNLSGRLFSPLVGFDIYLPNADEETRTYLKNVITTEEELSRQFLYLLVMNSFYSDPSYRSSLTTASTGTSAMAVTTTEMLSNQLSNWLSQISNDFDIGFVYRPGYKDINSQEVQVALSTQILNDKVVINGNFDVRGADNSYGNPITGDFDIEYKLAEKIRLKVFNRFNNPYTGKGVPYTQGIGIFFKQDFNSLTDLLKKNNNKSDMKKEEEVAID
ncbi:MAG: translocation/assembly module TamB domain-containing protein [Bacteroidales bacterium]|jgi:hypothetical protein|nr:translocation/assembly module TamB domain-containing protein [Bacteroidales bacterium]